MLQTINDSFKTSWIWLPFWREFATSSTRGFGIGRAVVTRCSLFSKKESDSTLENYSFPEILKKYGYLCPEITRRLWRVSALSPEKCLQMLLHFESEKYSSSMVEFLWTVFRWAPRLIMNFHHWPRSYEIMVSMLIQCQMLEDAEYLVLSLDSTAILSKPSEIFSDIIRGYSENFRLQNAIALYNQARNQGLELSYSCYHALLNLLAEKNKSDLALKVYMDMMETEIGLCAEGQLLNFVVGSLGKNRKTLEAVHILRRSRAFGIKANPSTLDVVIQGLCRKKDYEDVLNIMKEWEYIPSSFVGNKMISSICKNLGSDYAWFFIQELKALNFKLDDITFGILIVQSCRERKLRAALIYLSESFSRGLKLNVHTYNAIISGVLKEGMWQAAKAISEEMVDRDILLDLSTLKILLAGYCKYRKFLEIKNLLAEMEKSGFISLALKDDPLLKAFSILGLDCLGVKIKRDNDASAPKAEYFDCLGNGLYFEADNYEYEIFLDQLLNAAMSPDFDSLLLKECQRGDLDGALKLKNEAAQWGYDISPVTYSQFMKIMLRSSFHLKEAMAILDEESELWDQLDSDSLNLAVQSLSNNGMAVNAMSVLNRLLKRGLPVTNATFNSVILGFYKEKNLQNIKEYLELLEGITYSLCSKDINVFVSCLCKSGMVEEMFLFFDSMTEKYPNLVPSFVTAILKELNSREHSNIGIVYLMEVLNRIPLFDHSFLKTLTETICQKSYGFLLHFLISSERIQEALLLKQHILSRRGNHGNVVYLTLLNKLLMKGKLREATSQLQEMLANRVFPDDKILNALVHGLCRQNNLKKALEILAIMLRSNADISVSAYRSLIHQLFVHGQLLKGALILQKLFQVENSSKLLIFQNVLIFSLFQAKRCLLVDTVLNNMRKKHLLPDANTYNLLVYGYHKCGIVPRAVEVFYDMISHGIIPNNRSFRIIICYFCRHGELTKALELSNMMISHGRKLGSCIQNFLATSLISCGQLSEAICFLDQIEEHRLNPEHAYYDLLIKEFMIKGKVQMAIQLLNLMLKKGSLPCQTSYISVIHGLCICKAFDEAADFFVEMIYNGLEPDVASSDSLVHGLIDSRRIDEARRILDLMLEFSLVPTCSMYNHIISGYYDENNMEKASELLQEMQKAGHSPNFEIHWFLISHLSSSTRKENNQKGFISSLLSGNPLLVKSGKGRSVSTI